jgi:diacylglycerol kinase (ATP)
MTARLILNPYAGRWKALRARGQVEAACAEAGIEYELTVTGAPGEGIAIARQAVLDGYSPIVAVGGDGTISEVVNGMLEASGGERPPAPLGVIPLGSADDLADMLGIPKEVAAACHVIAAGHERVIDAGRVNGRYFDNNSAVGLEPLVTLNQMRMKRVKGTLRYVLAALKAILGHRPWRMHLQWDGGEHEGRVVLVSVGNTPRTGGAFFMTPQAQPDDGLFDFIFADAMGRLRLLRLLPSTFDGSHIGHPKIHCQQTTRLTIDCDHPTPIHADGELFELAATHITYELLPARLRVLVPAPSDNQC